MDISTIEQPEPRLLCVDPDRRTQLWVRNVLRSRGVTTRITTVSTGREAFNLLAREEFDLCILDYALPDMTGVQLCSLMRHMGCNVPMLVFTAMDRAIDRRRAAECRVDAYLTKTGDLERFDSTVLTLLEYRRVDRTTRATLFDMAKAA